MSSTAYDFYVKFIDEASLEDTAKNVLQQSPHAGQVSVAIEKIIELEYKLDVIPLPRLGIFNIVGYINSGLSAIYVDSFVAENILGRYRFTLAHEFSHVLIHSYFYNQLKFDNVEEWAIVMSSIPEKYHRRLEIQANNLAGYLLVPSDRLYEQANDLVEQLKISSRYDLKVPIIQRHLNERLAARFRVSKEVMTLRVKKESLWEKI